MLTKRLSKKRKPPPWEGWTNEKPKNKTERRSMRKTCGRKCFLAKEFRYPICKRNTCKVSRKGLWSAYLRGKHWSKKEIIHKGLPKSTHRAVWKRAQKLLKTMRKPKKSINSKK